jgi:hypothetical protein
VSIKKKFATTVATASLLAGIFGSAFVPSALAARGDVDDPKSKYTTVTAGAGLLENDDADAWGFYATDSDATVAEDTATLTFTLWSAGAAGVGTTEVASADLIATSSSSNLLVAWADQDTAAEDTCEEIDGATDYFAKSDSLPDTSEHTAGDGDYVLCVAAKEDDSSANATITIQARAGDSTGSYVTVETVSVLVLGPTASLALSISGGYKYIANENTELADWITVIGRDAAGNVLNGGDGSVTEGEDLADIANWDSNPDNAQEDQIVFLHDSVEAADADGAMTQYDVNEDVCNEGDGDEVPGDEGKSYTVKVEDAATGLIVSNGITITCTLDSSEAVVTGITASASSGPQIWDDGTGDDGELVYSATVKDADGRPLGDGAATQNFLFTGNYTAATAVDTELTANDFGTEVAVGGEISVSDIDDGFDFGRRGRFTMTFTADDSDLGAAENVEKTFTVTYVATGSDDVSISRTRNAAKTRATISADMGEENAYLRVEFFVELANGNLKTYTRRANDAGVAVLIQSRRNTTVYVYADLAGEDAGSPTDVLAVKFK